MKVKTGVFVGSEKGCGPVVLVVSGKKPQVHRTLPVGLSRELI